MQIRASYDDLRSFVSFYHLCSFSNNAVFDRIAHLAEVGVEADVLALLLWATSDVLREGAASDIAGTLAQWFDPDSDNAICRERHPELLARIVDASKFANGDVFITPIHERNVVLMDSYSTGDHVHNANFTVDGFGYNIDFDKGVVSRNEAYDEKED